jgi:lipoprotein-releasing system permease protein
MKTVSLFLAWRYLRGPKQERTVSIMIKVCFLGILIGSCALALVLGVMNGFEKVTHEKLQGIHAQIIMRAHGQPLAIDEIAAILDSEFPEIRAWSPSDTRQAIIQHPDSDDISNVVMLKGIDPVREEHTSALGKKIRTTTMETPATLPALITENHLMIGNKLAENLDLFPGDTAYLLVTQDTQSHSRKITLERVNASIGGTFNTGIDEFDSGVIFCTLPFLEEIFPDAAATQLNISLHSNVNEAAVIERLRTRFKMEVYSWQDLYPALVSALKLEKYAMGLVLALIVLVASMNIISLLFMQITRKRTDIAILQAIGMSHAAIEQIFIWIGMIISIIASTAGLLLAGILGFIIERYPIIELPDVYYVGTHLPVALDASIYFGVFALILTMGFCATFFSARSTRKINISNVLRFEA